MKSKITKFFWLVIFIISVSIFSSTQIQAASIPISVKPVIPENQIGDVTSFYQLKVKPEQKQDLEMELENSSDQPITVDLAINPASTGMSGSLIYNQGKSNKLHLAPVTLTDIASVEQHVEVPAKGKKKIKIHLEVPKEKFEGVILGALRISDFDDKAEQPKEDAKAKSESFSVNNKYAYAIAIQLQEEEKINVKPEIKLDKVIASQIAGRNTIKAQLQNPAPVILNGLTYNVKVTSQKKMKLFLIKK